MKGSSRHIFNIYHPAVNMLYISAALLFLMLSFHPVYLGISLMCGSIYSIYLNGFDSFKRTFLFTFIIFTFVAVINPLFNHQGTTLLFYALGNPVTLESVAFGIASGCMLASMFIWFTCYNAIMTNEKFLYLFGKPLPAAALMISMITRLIPVTRYRLKGILDSQKAMGMPVKTIKQKISLGVRVSSILMSWTMENSIETADSMKARGYGSGKRSSFSVFRWNLHDTYSFFVILFLISITGYAMIRGRFSYFPVLDTHITGPLDIAGYLIYMLLLLYPLILESRESIRWK